MVTGRVDAAGEPLEPVLITRHLGGSMPYRSMFETTLRPATMHRLMDALAVLLVRLHLAGFAWGDCSLSNTLFRRDAGAYAAYLVDAETGDLHPQLSNGQRDYDLDLARVNISGELLDLEASGALHPSVDPIEFGMEICARYQSLWEELTRVSVYPAGKYHFIERRIRRLNELGFDVAEMQIEHSSNGDTVTFVPKVVDAGHHQRQLLRLTGLDAEENQARRLLNDLESWMATQDDYAPGDPSPPGPRCWRTGGCGTCSGRPCGPYRWSCGVRWTRRRSTTSCSNTAGTCPSTPSTTSVWTRRSTTTSRTSCRGYARRWHRPPRSDPGQPAAGGGRRAADDKARRNHALSLRYGFPVQAGDGAADREFREARHVLGDGREVDVGEPGQARVVEADHGDLTGDGHTGAQEGVEDAGGAAVVEGKYRTGPGSWGIREQGAGAARAVLLGGPAGQHRTCSARPWRCIAVR